MTARGPLVAMTVAASLVAALVASLGMTLSPAAAAGDPPVTQPDAVTLTIESAWAHVDLAANDVDPEGDRMLYGGTTSPVPSGVGIVSAKDDLTDVYAVTGAVPGRYDVGTVVCDGVNCSPSTLTITVLPSPATAMTFEKKVRRGLALVSNNNDYAVRFYWGAEHRKRPDGFVDVPAHTSQTIRIYRKSLVTLAVVGTEYAIGVKRGLKVKRDGTALAPGLDPGHGIPQARSVHWVRQRVTLP